MAAISTIWISVLISPAFPYPMIQRQKERFLFTPAALSSFAAIGPKSQRWPKPWMDYDINALVCALIRSKRALWIWPGTKRYCRNVIFPRSDSQRWNASPLREEDLPPTFYCYGTEDPLYDQFLANAYAVRLEMEICSTDLVSEEAGAPIMTVSW